MDLGVGRKEVRETGKIGGKGNCDRDKMYGSRMKDSKRKQILFKFLLIQNIHQKLMFQVVTERKNLKDNFEVFYLIRTTCGNCTKYSYVYRCFLNFCWPFLIILELIRCVLAIVYVPWRGAMLM